MKSGKKALIIAIVLIVLVAAVVVLTHNTDKVADGSDASTSNDISQSAIRDDTSSEAADGNSDESATDEKKESVGDTEKDGETSRPDGSEKSVGKNADEYFGKDVTPRTIANDKTGNWKLVEISSDKGNIEEYAADYYQKYFEKNDGAEVHWIVNLANKTTTSIVNFGNILSVDTYEYVDGEENDAGKIGGGKLLDSHYVWLDSGKIEEVANSDE